MAFRVRKSVKLGPGVRLNASNRGLGISAGARGARYSVNSSGRKTKSVGLPGTGVGYVSSKGGGSRARSSGSSHGAAPPPTPPPKPGMLAPAHEKAFFRGINLYVSGKVDEAYWHFQDAAHKDEKSKSIADDFFAGLLAVQLGKHGEATAYLERVVASPIQLPDDLMSKYIQGGSTAVGITPQTEVTVPFGSVCATLALAEVYQATGRPDEAIGLLQQLLEVDRDPALVLSLAELLAETEAWDDLAELTAGTKNEDDVSLATCLFQAEALESQGIDEAALEVYRDALRSKKREDALLKQARYRRGKLYIKLGKKAQGRKDLGRVYADDPSFEDVAEMLQAGD